MKTCKIPPLNQPWLICFIFILTATLGLQAKDNSDPDKTIDEKVASSPADKASKKQKKTEDPKPKKVESAKKKSSAQSPKKKAQEKSSGKIISLLKKRSNLAEKSAAKYDKKTEFYLWYQQMATNYQDMIKIVKTHPLPNETTPASDQKRQSDQKKQDSPVSNSEEIGNPNYPHITNLKRLRKENQKLMVLIEHRKQGKEDLPANIQHENKQLKKKGGKKSSSTDESSSEKKPHMWDTR